jgi:hypothetical protein
MNLVSIMKELQAEQAAGNQMTTELVSRIDAHIRDLELLKAWIDDNGTARYMAIEGLLNGTTPPVQTVLPFETKDT